MAQTTKNRNDAFSAGYRAGSLLRNPFASKSEYYNTTKEPLTQNYTDTINATPSTDLYGTMRSTLPTAGGGGMIDLSNIFKSLEQGAQTQRDIAKQTYDTRREDLLTSLKRFQDQNARDVQNQQRAYLSNQASVESAIAQADRQNRISAAARGLGGSGLQQLAQLQNLLSQGQTISNMATENQNVMDSLRRALSEEEENYRTGESRALADYNNTLNKIASDLAITKADRETVARENALNRAHQASLQNQAYGAQAQEKANALSAELDNLQRQYGEALKSANTSQTVKDAREAYQQTVGDILARYSVPADSLSYSNARNYLEDAYNTTLGNASWLEDRLSNPLNYFGRTNAYGRAQGRLNLGDLLNLDRNAYR